MKALYVLLAVCVVAIMAFMAYNATQKPLVQQWAETAPLVKVRISAYETAWELLKERIPISERRPRTVANVIAAIEQRTDQKLAEVRAGEDILLPIPYDEWRSNK